MSAPRTHARPAGDSAARAAAKETIWRLAAIALGHPAPELQKALESGAFHAALNDAWLAVTGRAWPKRAPSVDFAALESGYIAAFLHGPKGKPVAPLLAGDHERLLAGHARPVFMLNIAAFYRHFGLQAAETDEGRADEPDHLASMLEFMAVLAHLEAQALRRNRDPAAYRRAQRDFLRRYLCPLLRAVADCLRGWPVESLDETIGQLVADLPDWADHQAAELEARVGRYRDPDAATAARVEGAQSRDTAAARVVDQNLWG
ncbi:molecular chaperone TorD family protein [Pelagibius sp.]|uniref:molecular chaperone TorD family protein n=1 Tax=Pelagibius sp. TaxID=1931238 RepID=UPI003BB1615C